MQAAISGLQGIALVIGDSGPNIIDVANPSVLTTCSNSFAQNFLSRGVDCFFVDHVSIEDIGQQLEASWDGHAIIRLVSIVIDPSADDDLRKDALDELDDLVTASCGAVEFAQRYLFSTPTLIDTSFSQSDFPPAIKSIITQIGNLQSAIAQVLAAVDDALSNTIQDESERAVLLATLIREGVIRKLVLAIDQASNLGDVLLFAYSLPVSQNMRPVLSAIQANLKALDPALNSPLQQITSERSDWDKDHQGSRRIRKRPSHHEYTKSIVNRDSIDRELKAGRLSNARKYVDEFISYQLKGSGAKYAVKTLCDIATRAQSLGHHDFQLELAHRAIELDPSDGWSHIQYAQALKVNGCFDDALSAYIVACAMSSDPVAQTGYAETLRSMGRFDEALKAYSETKRQHPDDVVAQNGYAETLRSMGRFDEALEAYSETKRQHPYNVFAQTGYAETLRSMGRFDEALKAYSETKRQHPDDVVAQNGYAETLRSMGRFDEALEAYSETKRQHPDNVFAQTGYAETLRSMGRFDEALEAYSETKRQHPDNVFAQTGYAETLRSMGRFDEALEAYSETKRQHPDDVVAQNGYAETLRSMGRFDEALEAYSETKRQHPDDVFAQNGYAETLRSMGRFDEALEAYSETKRQHPDNVFARTGYAETLRSMGRFDDALEAYSETKRQHLDNVVAQNGYAETLRSMGRFDEALKAYSETKRQHPDYVVAQCGYAETLRSMGRFDEALNAFVRVISQHNASRYARSGYFSVLVALQRYEEVKGGLATLIPSSKDDWIDYHILGMSYLRKGDLDTAKSIFLTGVNECEIYDCVAYFRNALAVALLRKGDAKAAVDFVKDDVSGHPVVTLIASHANACAGEISKSQQLLENLPATLSISQQEVRNEINAQYIVRTGAKHDFDWLIDQHILHLMAA